MAALGATQIPVAAEQMLAAALCAGGAAVAAVLRLVVPAPAVALAAAAAPAACFAFLGQCKWPAAVRELLSAVSAAKQMPMSVRMQPLKAAGMLAQHRCMISQNATGWKKQHELNLSWQAVGGT